MNKCRLLSITIILSIILVLTQNVVFCEMENELSVNLNNYIYINECKASNEHIEFFKNSTISYNIFVGS